MRMASRISISFTSRDIVCGSSVASWASTGENIAVLSTRRVKNKTLRKLGRSHDGATVGSVFRLVPVIWINLFIADCIISRPLEVATELNFQKSQNIKSDFEALVECHSRD